MATTINAGTATSGAAISADTTGILQLQSGSTPTTAVTINTSQNVGVGTTSPTAKLHVYGGSNNQFKVESSGAEANFTLAGTSYGQFENSVGDLYITNDASANMIFRTASTERMRITSAGQLLIGKTVTTSSVVGNLLQGNGNNQFNCNNDWNMELYGTGQYRMRFAANDNSVTQVGSITVTASATSYATSSDYRLKENVAPMQNALATVALLKPVTYTWKKDGLDGQGFIAHELQEVVPDCVTGEKDAVDKEGNPVYQGIDTSFLVATLTAAIQELNAKVEAQALEIKALKGVA